MKHAKLTVIVAVLAIIAAAAYGGPVADLLGPYGDEDDATESVQATDRYGAASGEDASPGLIVLVRLPGDVGAAASRQRVQSVVRTLEREQALARTQSFYETRDPAMVSRDRRSTWVGGVFR